MAASLRVFACLVEHVHSCCSRRTLIKNLLCVDMHTLLEKRTEKTKRLSVRATTFLAQGRFG